MKKGPKKIKINNHTARKEELNDLGAGRNHYQRDYTAILYSHAFRRLRHKTQVFFYTDIDHVCTRLDHSLYVSTISEIVCLNLQKKDISCDPILARTIGIGHDLGHAPFGHAGERALNKLAKGIGGFEHEKHSLRVVDKIEKPRDSKPIIGLNLTLAVRDGIVNHCGEDKSNSISPVEKPKLEGRSNPWTLEGCVVKLVDKIAYLGRDLEDAIIYGLDEKSIPGEIKAIIGFKNGEIVDYFVKDLIESSNDKLISLSDTGGKLMEKLYEFDKEQIYQDKRLKVFEERVNDVLETLFVRFLSVMKKYGDNIHKYGKDSLVFNKYFGGYISKRVLLYFDEEKNSFQNEEKLYKRIVIDFLSTLTDNFVFEACREYFLPKPIEPIREER
jgi:dGTPase